MTHGVPQIHSPEGLCPGCFSEPHSGSADGTADGTSVASACGICGFDGITAERNPLELLPGTLLKDQYLVGRALGHGGFGITYLGWDTNLKLKVALKEYFPSQWASRQAGSSGVSVHSQEAAQHFKDGLEKFLDEGRTLARFHQVPGIVSVLNFFRENHTGYLVMSFVEGITLKQYLEKQGGKISAEAAVRVLLPVMDALAQVHEAGVLHRDISPDNIYITHSGQVKLLDFGAARMALGEEQKSLSVIYKPGFAPPEQYMSQGKQGRWTDVYALAATLYQAITGITPSQSVERFYRDELKSPSSLGEKISPAVEAALLKALAVDFQHRFQSMREFQNALMEDGVPVEIPGFESREDREEDEKVKPRRQKRKPENGGEKQSFPWRRAGAGAAILVVLAVVGYFAKGAFYSEAMVEERLRGRWEQARTMDGLAIGAKWQLERNGAYTCDFTYKDSGVFEIRGGSSWSMLSSKNPPRGGTFAFEDGNTILLGMFPLSTAPIVPFKRRSLLPAASRAARYSVIGIWEQEFKDFGAEGKRVLTIRDNGNYELIIVAHGAGQIQARDGIWKLRSSIDEVEEYGTYIFQDSNPDRPNHVVLNGRTGMTMQWDRIF